MGFFIFDLGTALVEPHLQFQYNTTKDSGPIQKATALQGTGGTRGHQGTGGIRDHGH